ncbi:MAG: sulfur carrier protein ThiS [Planctomycetota bacterium]|nr:sulfur carrier protein ThiS [Planctomycetota bacterium]
MGEAIRIRLNGEDAEVAAGTTIGALVDGVTKDRSRIAVERNKEIVPRTSYDQQAAEEGDVIEIVTLVGGG